MNHQYASRVGEAHSAAARIAVDNFVDRGVVLIRTLHEMGFDIIPHDAEGAVSDSRTTLNDMCGLKRG